MCVSVSACVCLCVCVYEHVCVQPELFKFRKTGRMHTGKGVINSYVVKQFMFGLKHLVAIFDISVKMYGMNTKSCE